MSRTAQGQTQSRLLTLAAIFLGVYALALTLSPAVRLRSWEVDLHWRHWLGYVVWLGMSILAHHQTSRKLPGADPYLLPVAALLSGWGLLTVWRLAPDFGLRQTAWLVVGVAALVGGLRRQADLALLRRYKYVWLTSGLLLTALTLLFGTNPLGYGPRLWLGCCGLYFQPSEPLKLLLIVYMAAYLADHRPRFTLAQSALARRRPAPLFPLLAPTLIMTGLALLLLVVQRDLGTASIFLFLYTIIVYIATGNRRILLTGGLSLVVAGAAGYALFDVVRLRVDAWLNPWLDPSGRSYQIVQSLLAVANGGLLGRGPGLGNPGLVPIPHSDFIFAAIAEEMGLIGAIGLLALLALLANRGVRIALNAPDAYRRYLAAGLTAHLVAQSILIIGGNLRLLPLTGVTLPFVSYGGSSLLVSFLALLLLLKISQKQGTAPFATPSPSFPGPYLYLNGFLLTGLAAAGLVAGWWAVYRGPDLLTRTDNARRAIDERTVRRGALLDRNDHPLAESVGTTGSYYRQATYPDLGPVIGYTHPIYGQSGLEASLDAYLRGVQGNPGLTVWWSHLLYGQPPPGLDVRLTLDLGLQGAADELLGEQTGALVLLNAGSGEILAMASHPSFDPNTLDQDWPELIEDPRAPLLNRAAMGLYPPGPVLGPLLLGAALGEGGLPPLGGSTAYQAGEAVLECALPPAASTWGARLSAGCPGTVAALGEALGGDRLIRLYQDLGLFSLPHARLPVLSVEAPAEMADPELAALGIVIPTQDLRFSPLQMALGAASLSNAGVRPAPRLVQAVNTSQAGWVVLPYLEEPNVALSARGAEAAAGSLAQGEMPIWLSVGRTTEGGEGGVTWFLGGTLPDWVGVPLSVAVVIEVNDPSQALEIGRGVLQAALALSR